MAINQSEYSSIEETCHQCCHKISGFAASCKNRKKSKRCLIKLCPKCLLDRYGEKAERVAVFQGWLCPKCRGICNCIVCMEKKGHQPTGVLTNTKKATGFSTDIEMLKRLKYLSKERIASCMATPLNRDVLPKKRDKGIFSDGKVDSCDSLKNPKKTKKNESYELGNVENNNNKRKLSDASINGDENKSKISRMNRNTKEKGNVSCVSVSVVAKNDKGKEKVSEFLVSRVTAEDLSEALQFLEFCSAFEKRAGRGIEQGWGDGDGSSSSSPVIVYDKHAIYPEDDMPEDPHDLPKGSSGGRFSASTSNTLSLPECYPVSKKKLMPGTVSKTITKIMKKNIHKDGVNWRSVPDPHKMLYFEEFKSHYRWPLINEGEIQDVFMRQAAGRYRDMVHTFKRKPGFKRPECVPEDAWKKWLAYWSLPEVIAKSEMARQNRYSEKAGPGTGCSALEHSLALQKESERTPNAYQCFLRTYKRKDGTFVDERSRLIAAGVEERVAAARQVASDAPIDIKKIYLEVVGRVDRQRLYGLGSQVAINHFPLFQAEGGTLFSGNPPDVLIDLSSSQSNLLARNRQEQEELTMQLVQQFEKKTTRTRDRLAAKKRKMQGQMQAEMQEMQQRVARMLEELYSQGLFPKPPRMPNAWCLYG